MKEAFGTIQKEAFGTTKDGQSVEKYTLTNKAGMSISLITRGATLQAVHVPDRAGKLADVVLGFDDVAGYESKANPFFGCTTGRVANRIAGGKFTINGKTYQLALNNGPNTLHGGTTRTLDKVVWKAETVEGKNAVRFTFTSPDGDEGFPGNLACTVTYTLADDNAIHIDYEATTDQATPVNLTNHSYFNLAGAGSGSVLDQVLTLKCSRVTTADQHLIPTGALDPVSGTPLDFTKPTAIGERIAELDQTQYKGYDHNFVIDRTGPGMVLAATAFDPDSGRKMTCETDQPGVQLYTGNHLAGVKGKAGKSYEKRGAFCLETQNYPNAVNTPSFPDSGLEQGETYRHQTVYRFSVEK